MGYHKILALLQASIALLLFNNDVVQSNPLFPQAHPDVSKNSALFGTMSGGGDQLNKRIVTSTCTLYVSTNGWTTCNSLLADYKMSLAKFSALNPDVGSLCQNFRPGTKYCLRKPYVVPVSTDGRCGSNSEALVTCIGSTYGSCCGKNGFCGSTDAFCAVGNCQSGECPGLGYSFDGNCGLTNGLDCGGSWGSCCSIAGKCGSTLQECGVGNCLSGACVVSSASTSTTTTTSIPSPTPRSPSLDGTCGFKNGYICNGTSPVYNYGKCCSAAGFCGLTEYHCKDLLGCQDKFGLCDKTVLVTVTQKAATSSSATVKPITTPTPVIPGIVSNCDLFVTVKDGDTCASIAASRGITLDDFFRFNPSLPRTCFSGLWSGYNVCISIPRHETGVAYSVTTPVSPAPTAVASYGGYRLWGCISGVPAPILPSRYADTFMTLEKCLSNATSMAAKWAAIEYGWICRTGNTFNLPSNIPYPTQRPLSNCNTRCGGQPEQLCGGVGLLTLYERM